MPLPNIIQMEDDLKNVSDEQLVEYMQNPPSGMPQFLTLQEMDRRREMRESFQATQGQPQQNIAQELTSYTAGGGQQGPQGQQGIGSLPAGSAGGAEMQSRMNGNAPVPYRGGQVQSMGQPQGQATMGAPPMPKGMASGGIVGYQNRGQVNPLGVGRAPSPTEQLVRQLLPQIKDPAQIAMIVQTVGEIDPAAGRHPAAMRGLVAQIRKLGSTMGGQATAGRDYMKDVPFGRDIASTLEKLPAAGITALEATPLGGVSSIPRSIYQTARDPAVGEYFGLPESWAQQPDPLSNMPKGALDTGLEDSNVPVLSDKKITKEKTMVGEPDATGTDYASYLEEIQALERTPEQIKGDAMTNALIELSGLAGAATRAETAEVLRKAGRSAQGIRETGKKELRENILARMQIETAGDQAELNKLKTESEIRYRDALAKQAELAESPEVIYGLAVAESLKVNGKTPKGKSWGALGLKFYDPTHKQLFINAYLADKGLTMADVQNVSSVPGGGEIITEAEL